MKAYLMSHVGEEQGAKFWLPVRNVIFAVYAPFISIKKMWFAVWRPYTRRL